MTTKKKRNLLDQLGLLWFMWAIIVWPFAMPHPWNQVCFWTQLAILTIGAVITTHKIRKPKQPPHISATNQQYYDAFGNTTENPNKAVYSLSHPTHRYDDEPTTTLYRDRTPDYPG